MNKITAVGRLAADAETRYLPNGDALCSFRVASDVGYGDKKTTNWFTCSIFGKRSESLAPYLTKGQQVTVFGTLTLREWTDKDGAKRMSPEIRIDDIALQGGKRDAVASDGQPARVKNGRMAEQGPAFDEDSDIPF